MKSETETESNMFVAAPVDAASESSSKDDRSKTEASSIDLEWEHEAGMIALCDTVTALGEVMTL